MYYILLIIQTNREHPNSCNGMVKENSALWRMNKISKLSKAEIGSLPIGNIVKEMQRMIV